MSEPGLLATGFQQSTWTRERQITTIRRSVFALSMDHGQGSGINAITDLGTLLIEVPRIRGKFHVAPCLPTRLNRPPDYVPRRLLVRGPVAVSERTTPGVGVAARSQKRSCPPHCRNSGSTRDGTNGNTSDTDQHPSIC